MARQRTSGRRTDYGWRGAVVNSTTDNSTNALIIHLFTEASTVMRVRGFLRVVFATATDADDIRLAAGIMIRGEGLSGSPSPGVELEKSWMWHGFGRIVFDAGLPGSGATIFDFNIDSKAMRKVKENDELILCVNGTDITGTGTAIWVGGVRLLVGR